MRIKVHGSMAWPASVDLQMGVDGCIICGGSGGGGGSIEAWGGLHQ